MIALADFSRVKDSSPSQTFIDLLGRRINERFVLNETLEVKLSTDAGEIASAVVLDFACQACMLSCHLVI